MAPLYIVVVGGGIGGPAAAVGLARNGHRVSLYEQATNTSEVGYAFRVTPNAEKCLRHLGIDVEAGGAVSCQTMRIMDHEGNVKFERTENDTDDSQKGKSVFAHRPRVNAQLLDAAKKYGVQVQVGVKVEDVNVDTTTVMLDNGDQVRADLIIAADGVHSVVRPHIVDESRYYPYASTGHNAFRFLLSKEQVEKDQVMSSIISDDVKMFMWTGNGKWLISYPVDFGNLFSLTCSHPEHLSDPKGDEHDVVGYDRKASIATALKAYEEFEPRAKRVFKLADPDGLRIWKQRDMDEIPSWSKNRTVLLGDACHAVQPFSFSGAAMAIEDAVTLEVLLPASIGPDQISQRLKLYEDIRKPRIARIRQAGRDTGTGKTEEDLEYIKRYREFLDSHDAVDYARSALTSP